ncbi:MAG: transglutaminase domain-containing protein [Candidatus Poribacteria bacterium]
MFNIKLAFLRLSLVIIASWSYAVEHTIQDLNFKAEKLENMLQLPQDDWLNLTLMGTKIGYAHVYAEQSEYDDEPAIRIRSEIVMEIKRTGTNLRLAMTRIAYLGTDLMPRHFVSTSNETGQEKMVEGIIHNGILEMATTLANNTTKVKKEIPPDTIFDLSVSYFVSQHDIRVGNHYKLNVFSMDVLEPIETEIRVVRQDQINYQGKLQDVYVVDYTMDIMGGITTTEWISQDGTTYQMETGLLGLKMELIKTDMETALGEAGEVDVILTTKIFAQGERPISGNHHLKAYLRLDNGDLEKAIVQNQRQRIITGANPRDGEIEVWTIDLDKIQAPDLPIKTSETEPYLQSTVYIQADHPAIRSAADEIVGSQKNAWIAAQKICNWVYKSITDKNLKIGFGSALQTLDSLSGDCTEHTVLMIGLARSIGIPARVCAGLVFQGDAFYYHFWPEVFVNQWIAMDPTLGQVLADATHIQLAGSGLESDSMIEFGEGVLRTLNQLHIEITN